MARHLDTLAAMVSGIVRSQSSQLPAIARKVPDGNKPESRVKRYARWVKNEHINNEVFFLPFAEPLLQGLAQDRPLVLAMDGSEVGRGCLTLMVSVIYKQRALPVAWVTVKGSKGHFSEATHVQLLTEVHALVPPASDVVFLGDGEFDGTNLQAALNDYEWAYVCRTAKHVQLCEGGDWFAFADLDVPRGAYRGVPDVALTQQEYGPVLAIAWWQRDCKEPLYLVTNLELVAEACSWYNKRFRIETFFSDQKSRGFNLHKSHIADPARLARLMIAACLAYIWIIYLGVIAKRDNWVQVIHRTDRCDLSLFQLGLRLLEQFLNEHLPIPVAFDMPRAESVR